jgi:cobaltochelatase CobN
MHLLRTETRSLDEAEAAIDLGQSPGDILFLSFSDADLALVASATKLRQGGLGVRLANLSQLKHPYSVDLYVASVASKARFILVRLLGGLDYWRYGIEELSRAARAAGALLAVIPGDASPDARLLEASTLPEGELRLLAGLFQQGGIENIKLLLGWIEARIGGTPQQKLDPASAIPAAGYFEAASRNITGARGKALVIFYRSLLLAGDLEPIHALAEACAARGLDVTATFVTSLKDQTIAASIRAEILRERPDIILNTTAFSSRLNDGSSVLDDAEAPVFQVILSGASRAQWESDSRGLGAADLAMNIVLPEMDGRLITRAISCKEEAEHLSDLEFTPRIHRPLPNRIGFVADLATAWVKLRKSPRFERKLACILSDYPAKGGRTGYAVGLDTPASVVAIAVLLRQAGFTIGAIPKAADLMRHLETGATLKALSLDDYRSALSTLPPAFVESLISYWGQPEEDRQAASGCFTFAVLEAGHFILGVQPDRGARASRKADYHDAALPPCHSYVAFYLWLRHHANIDAMIHCGTHGTLEWLPGKAVALNEDCAPEALLGPTPVIYPFIVNNPGEAAQAKRRIAALTIGHLTPPLTRAGSHGAAQEIEALLDEYAAAERLDPRRAKLLASAILDRAKETGFLQESGVKEANDPIDALQKLDAFLCDLKDMRIADGLHVFGHSPEDLLREATIESLAQDIDAGHDSKRVGDLIDLCGPCESNALLAALDGRFVPPGPGGAPSRGRLDVLPTGRNIFGTDPRSVPTPTAYEIGKRAALEIVTRHAQDRGDWPRRMILDLWASATLRTGGDDLGQAFALLGVRPTWDPASARVSGFEILPQARLDYPRIDVTLRISGLFRDIFPGQIALFDQVVRAIADLNEDETFNPLAAARREGSLTPRIFGAAPGAYGMGISRAISEDPFVSREALAALYLASAPFSYGGAKGEGAATDAFKDRVARADALIHVQDQDGADSLDSDAILDHEAGFAAAAKWLGSQAAIYHVDSTRPTAIKVRTLAEDIARTLRGRASNPRWISGLMRHGHRGAAEIAETLDHLFAAAVLTDLVESRHFELMFEATCASPEVRIFLIEANPEAAQAIADRFDQAIARNFWRPRRNSFAEILAGMREARA